MGEPKADKPRRETPVMSMLRRHVPLSLLCDLAGSPRSAEILAVEGLPDRLWWTLEGGAVEPECAP